LPTIINLFIWGDSLSFRRPFQNKDVGFTYPHLIQRKIESTSDIRVNLMVRSRGGITIHECQSIIQSDCAYISAPEDNVFNIAVLQVGIVDCGLLPFTYPLIKISKCIPYIGGYIVSGLKKSRPFFQRINARPRTSQSSFRKKYQEILKSLSSLGFLSISVGLPTPTDEIETRSPGFQKSSKLYSEIIKSINAQFIDIEQLISNASDTIYNQEQNKLQYVVREDGHHLTEKGHELYGMVISDYILKLIKHD
jgi:hypothetical protein